LSLLAERMEIVRDRRSLVVQDGGFLLAADDVTGHGHAPSADGHMPVDDELPRLSRCEGEALEEGERLKSTREDRFDVEGEDVVEGRAVEGQQPHAAEPSEELLPFLLRLLVPRTDERLKLPRSLAESAETVLRAPQLLLVLEPVLLEEIVL
jgi:hypothetical protein